jgi:acyl-coenzyme A thioesterase PaaI-like protein
MSEEAVLPGARACFLCGTDNPHGLQFHLERCDDRVYLRCIPERHLQGFPGIMHGGFVAMFLDEVIGTAVGVSLDRVAVTRNLDVDYLKPVRVGRPIVVEGWAAGSSGGHFHRGEGTLTDADGVVLARARAEFAVMSRSVVQRIFGLGPGDLTPDEPLR